jgi:C1A family cysteine protease
MSWISNIWNNIKYTFVKEPKYTGCKADPKDDRDHIKDVSNLELPKASANLNFSLREYCPQVMDQGQTGSCTGYASAYAIHILISKMEKLSGIDNMNVPVFSPLWNYYHARLVDNQDAYTSDENFYKHDGGATLRGTMKALKTYGSIPDANYNLSTTRQLPSKLKGASKTSFKIKEYLSIPNGFCIESLETVQKILSIEQLPILACINFYSEQFSEANLYGLFRKLDGTKHFYGSHAICITGWKWMEGHLWIEFINSYGKDWGKKGYGYFDAEMLDDKEYISSLWTFDKGYF